MKAQKTVTIRKFEGDWMVVGVTIILIFCLGVLRLNFLTGLVTGLLIDYLWMHMEKYKVRVVA